MAEPLKNQYGPHIPRRIAAMLRDADPTFDADGFLAAALHGYDALELLPRGRHIAAAMARFLPADFATAAAVVTRSLGPTLDAEPNPGMGVFLYMPHGFWVMHAGIGHWDLSMDLLHAITQRFTSEFSIRPFIERYPDATLARLRLWTADPSPHVRRLVSEGTRHRLPWAPRLRAFQRDPTPVLDLLERLRDDPALYVRRSVANNLNDIGKDHPDRLHATAARWLRDATPERDWLVRHALRHAIKRGDPGALAALGYGRAAELTVRDLAIRPARARIGDTLTVTLTLQNPTARTQRVVADLRLHYIKANGQAKPKVFKLSTLSLAPDASVDLRKSLSLADMTTRRHYPGAHRLELLLNGQATPLGAFELRAE